MLKGFAQTASRYRPAGQIPEVGPKISSQSVSSLSLSLFSHVQVEDIFSDHQQLYDPRDHIRHYVTIVRASHSDKMKSRSKVLRS